TRASCESPCNGCKRSFGRSEDVNAIGPVSLPVVKHQPVRFEERSNLRFAQSQHLIENRHDDAECALTQHGATSDARKLAVRRNGDGEPVTVVYMVHDVNVRAAVAHIDDAIGHDAQALLQLFQHSDLAIASRHATNLSDRTRMWVVVELRPVNVIGRDDASQCRYDY